jgi:hypothetical protein
MNAMPDARNNDAQATPSPIDGTMVGRACNKNATAQTQFTKSIGTRFSRSDCVRDYLQANIKSRWLLLAQ